MIEKRLSDNNMSAPNESRRIEGYAVVFEAPSTGLTSFHEVIKRGALDGVIECSDVVATYDHNASRGILARSTNGVGSLKLEVDERGLKYSFDAPHTALGDELLEGIRRGDIRSSSFAFIVEKDEWEIRNGEKYRTITKIKQLFDVSAVVNPAYDAATVTVVDTRGAEQLDEVKEEPKQEEPAPQPEEAENREAEEEKPAEEPQEEPKPSEEEEPKEGDENREAEEEKTPESKEEPQSEEEPKTQPEEEENRSSEANNLYIQENNIKVRHMSKFKLISAINAIANGQALSEEAQAVNVEGRSIMTKSGLNPSGQFVLPCGCGCEHTENRDNGIFATVATQGKEAVPTDKLDILEPLRARLVLAQAGATILTGLQGNISLPTYSGSTAYWKGEVVKADNGEGTFGEINLAPKRLTAVIEVSKQFLIQSSDSADAMLQRDIVNAIADKLEATILGSAAATATQPAGLFDGVVADTAAVKHSDILEMEQDLEDANVYGEFHYIASPASKALLRGTVKGGAGSGRFLMENNEIEGIGVISTSNVVKGGLLLGMWSELILGQWGALDLTVDAITKADEGKVRIIVNSFYDCQKRRPDAIQARILKV